jgi:hypothetical protein
LPWGRDRAHLSLLLLSSSSSLTHPRPNVRHIPSGRLHRPLLGPKMGWSSDCPPMPHCSPSSFVTLSTLLPLPALPDGRDSVRSIASQTGVGKSTSRTHPQLYGLRSGTFRGSSPQRQNRWGWNLGQCAQLSFCQNVFMRLHGQGSQSHQS